MLCLIEAQRRQEEEQYECGRKDERLEASPDRPKVLDARES